MYVHVESMSYTQNDHHQRPNAELLLLLLLLLFIYLHPTIHMTTKCITHTVREKDPVGQWIYPVRNRFHL